MNEENANITWALLVPARPEHLTPLVRSAWEAKFEGLEELVPQWEILAGEADYTAVIDRRPGSEGDDEELAQQLSASIDGRIYLLELREDHEVVWTYERGRFVDELNEWPYALAERLKCPLPHAEPTPAETQAGGVTEGEMRSVCVVEGAGVEAVRRALGRAASLCRVDATAEGAIVSTESGAGGLFLHDLAEALPSATVYRLIRGPAPDRFGVLVIRGEEAIGNYEANGFETSYPKLDAVKGETAPAAIAARLHVSAHLLRLSAED